MVYPTSESQKQHHTLAILNLLVSSLILLVLTVWIVKNLDLASASFRAESAESSADSTQSSHPGFGQTELLIQASLLISALEIDCAVVVVLPREAMLASRSECNSAPAGIEGPSNVDHRYFAEQPGLATAEADLPRQIEL